MTTPDMVELGAMALFDDNPVWHLVHDRPALWGEVVESAKGRYRHQARAVLAAISEAGTVEWGIRYGDGDIDGGYLHKSEAMTDIARLRERVRLGYDNADDHEPMTLLTRHRFEHSGPWTAVEG